MGAADSSRLDGFICGKKSTGKKAESERAAENPEAAAGDARGARARVGLASLR